ncbi:RNA polymerase sigma factor [Flagellimonas sp. 2504JD1-5]
MKEDLESVFLNALEGSKEKIFRICVSYTKDTEEAKDLFQEVLVNIWKSLPNFKGNSALSTWIYRITINVSLRHKANLIKNNIRFPHLDAITIERVESYSEENQNEKQLHWLRDCVRKLNEVDKAIISLFLEELPYKEISKITGLKENTVAVRVKRIKEKLLNCLNEKL